MENDKQFIFRLPFSWRNWKNNYLKRSRLILWLFSQAYSTRYSRGSSCRVPWNFLLCNDHADTNNPLFRKQLMHLMFILLAVTLILNLLLNSITILKIIAEAAIVKCSPKVISKSNFLIVKVDFKKRLSNLTFNVQLFWKLKNHLVLCFMSQLQKKNKSQNFIFNFVFQFIKKTKQNKKKTKQKNPPKNKWKFKEHGLISPSHPFFFHV